MPPGFYSDFEGWWDTGRNGQKAQWDKKTLSGRLSDPKLAGFDFTGGTIHGRWCGKTEFWHALKIKAHSGDSITIDADAPNAKMWIGYESCAPGKQGGTVDGALSKGKLSDGFHEKFYIEALDALDKPGEWWYVGGETGPGTLYLYAPGGANPSDLRVMGKVQEYAFHLDRSKNVMVSGLSFFATGLNPGRGGGAKIDHN